MKEAKLLQWIIGFPLTLFITSAVPSNLSVLQVSKRGFQGAEAVDISVDDHFVHSSVRSSAFTWLKIIPITFLVNQNKWEINVYKAIFEHWKTSLLEIDLICWRKPNLCGKSSVFRQPIFSPVLYPFSWDYDKSVSGAKCAKAVDFTVWIISYISLNNYVLCIEMIFLFLIGLVSKQGGYHFGWLKKDSKPGLKQVI